MIIAVIDATFAVAKKKPEKNSGLYRIQILDLCDMGAAKVASLTKMVINSFHSSPRSSHI